MTTTIVTIRGNLNVTATMFESVDDTGRPLSIWVIFGLVVGLVFTLSIILYSILSARKSKGRSEDAEHGCSTTVAPVKLAPVVSILDIQPPKYISHDPPPYSETQPTVEEVHHTLPFNPSPGCLTSAENLEHYHS